MSDKNSDTNLDFLKEISNFTFTSKYARYNDVEKRRETYYETVARVRDMHLERYSFLSKDDKEKINWAFEQVNKKLVVPSMRSMQFGGKAVFAHNSRIYNCAARHVDSLRAFSESFYLLLCGVGVTFGISKYFINRLPKLANANDKTGTVVTYAVEDTIEGWADSVEALLMSYFKNTPYTGRKIVFDYSKVRIKGTPLKTGGGKAPGHEGLKQSHEKIKQLLDHMIEEEKNERMRPIHAYDILMHCADAVLSGGIRRAATAAIFDKDDQEMMTAKANFKVTKYMNFEKLDNGYYNGFVYVNSKKYEVTVDEYEYNEMLRKKKEISWTHIEPQRARSNNSVLLLKDETTREELANIISVTRQWGEPGFVFADHPWTLYNPCYEISFIPVTDDGICGVQFCNLSSQNGAKIKSIEDWMVASEAATIIGTLQAGYTNFEYLSDTARKLTEGEALLGVSMTGWMDNPKLLLDEKNQYMIAKLAVKINKDWAEKIGINQAARVTCTKPEGTSSLVLESSSGIHPHHAHRYFRRIQANKIDNVYKMFKSINPHMCEESVWSATNSDDVITFPIVVDKDAIVKNDLTAISHLNYIRQTQQNWVNPGRTDVNKKACTHNVSCTVEVEEDEWDKVIDYLFENREFFSAVALLPKLGDKMYRQSPLQRISDETDEELWSKIITDYKHVDYTSLNEEDDETTMTETIACGGGSCELPFIHAT